MDKASSTALLQSTRRIEVLGAACGHGAADPRCEAAPHLLRKSQLLPRLRSRGVKARWTGILRPKPRRNSDPLYAVRDLATRLAQRIEDIVRRGSLPVVLGGDHSCAVGTWKGVARAHADRGTLGLLWIDAHMDAHTPSTTPSGMLHGMPLACLLGHGPEALTEIAGNVRLDPRHVCLLGVRSYEPDEAALLKKLGVRVFYMHDIERDGLEPVMRQALKRVSAAQAGFGVTLDLDVIDPNDAPGTGIPVPGGIRAAALCSALSVLAGMPGLQGIEIVEYNPFRDTQSTTAGLISELIEAMLAGQRSLPLELPLIQTEEKYGAHHYAPLPVVMVKGQGVYLWDEQGRRYLDMLSAYSAVSHGHCHPRLTRVLAEQSQTLAVTSRACYNNRLPLFLKRLTEITGQDLALPANTGLEAVEAALKAVRKWAYKVKGVPQDAAEIIACEGNFHGRSIAIVGMSSEAQYRDGFGPFPAGFKRVPYGDATALARAITPNTAAFLVEPIQGEAGIIVPPPGYLAECARICRDRNVLLICDEVQTGLGRTGRVLACEHENVKPDGVILGKALGGGLLPVSAFAARRELMEVFTPGDHGSTFGGNPLAAAVGLEALTVMEQEAFAERAAKLGAYLLERLRALRNPLIREVRGKGLLIGIEVDPALASAHDVCQRMLEHGILTKDTHHTVIRLAPPLIITRQQLREAADIVRTVFAEAEKALRRAA